MTVEELEQEHKKLVIQLHPDRNTGDPDATAKFQEMQAQYEERKAELNGDYTKARKGMERREREERERQERERKERERRKVEQVIIEARKNKNLSHRDLKEGDYIYVQQVKVTDTENLHMYYLLRQMIENGINDECVVMIEKIFEANNDNFFNIPFNDWLLRGDIYGDWDVIQTADPASGVKKSKRVARVVMIRATDYCVFGNPMGDPQFSTFYLRPGYDTMFGSRIKDIRERVEYERQEKARIEAEKKARLLAEQKPMIEEWNGKLIAISAGLTDAERTMVALDNIKTMLKATFPGTTFRQRGLYGTLSWTDGPTYNEVQKVTDLFNSGHGNGHEMTPWQERFGNAHILMMDRKMSVLTKAKILQQLGSVTDAFSTSAIDEEVTVSEFDWMMLHMLVGININDQDASLCMSTLHADGSRTVNVQSAVRFVFNHSSFAKAKATKTKKAA